METGRSVKPSLLQPVEFDSQVGDSTVGGRVGRLWQTVNLFLYGDTLVQIQSYRLTFTTMLNNHFEKNS